MKYHKKNQSLKFSKLYEFRRRLNKKGEAQVAKYIH